MARTTIEMMLGEWMNNDVGSVAASFVSPFDFVQDFTAVKETNDFCVNETTGQLFATMRGARVVAYQADYTSVPRVLWTIPSVGMSPSYVTCSDQEVFVSDLAITCQYVVMVYDSSNGEYLRHMYPTGSPCGLLFHNEELFLTDSLAHRVQVLTKMGIPTRRIGSGTMQYPTTMAIEGDHLYVVDTNNSIVVCFDVDDGTIVRALTCREWRNPENIAIFMDRVYVSNRNGIYMFSCDTGDYLGRVETGTNFIVRVGHRLLCDRGFLETSLI